LDIASYRCTTKRNVILFCSDMGIFHKVNFCRRKQNKIREPHNYNILCIATLTGDSFTNHIPQKRPSTNPNILISFSRCPFKASYSITRLYVRKASIIITSICQLAAIRQSSSRPFPASIIKTTGVTAVRSNTAIIAGWPRRTRIAGILTSERGTSTAAICTTGISQRALSTIAKRGWRAGDGTCPSKSSRGGCIFDRSSNSTGINTTILMLLCNEHC